MHDLGTLGGTDAGILGRKGNVEMNERGQVVACSYTNSKRNPTTGTPTLDPFLWDHGIMHDLGTLGGTSGCAINLNNRGQVVGYSNLARDESQHPFLWDGKVMRDLGPLGSTFGYANSINDNGEVGGSASFHGEPTHAFLWKNGFMTDLGTLPHGTFSSTMSINSRGDVVGESGCNNCPFLHTFLRKVDGPMLDLDDLIPSSLHVRLVHAVNINDRGEIVGAGLFPNGNTHAVLLIPCRQDEQCED